MILADYSPKGDSNSMYLKFSKKLVVCSKLEGTAVDLSHSSGDLSTHIQ